VSLITKRKQLNEAEARQQAYQDLKPTYRKVLVQVLTNRIIWFNAMKQDPIYKRMRKSAKDLMDMEDFDKDEAWKYAVSKRKYLLDSVLDDFDPPRSEVFDERDEYDIE